MLILAIDTTTRTGSLAIARDGHVLREMSGDPSTTHAQRLPIDVLSLCREAGVALEDVDTFAVAAGPGSFTGLRVGIATVQGLAFATGKTVVPVSTLEAIASAAGITDRPLAAWMDAQRHQVFAQLFGTTGDSPPIAAPPADVLSQWRALEHLPDVTFHGDGAIKYADTIRQTLGAGARIASELPPLAAAVARIAAASPDRAVLPHAVVPIYVRRPDVELARERREGTR